MSIGFFHHHITETAICRWDYPERSFPAGEFTKIDGRKLVKNDISVLRGYGRWGGPLLFLFKIILLREFHGKN
jgi:hypothetical protein